MKYGCIIITCCFFAGCDGKAPPQVPPPSTQNPKGSVLPTRDVSEVARIEVSAGWDEEGKIIESTCLVAPADYGKVLDLFDDGVVDANPAKWEVWGAIVIEYRSGRSLHVDWFLAGEKAAYKIGDTYYRGSSHQAFLEVFKNCRRSQKPDSPQAG